MFTGIVTDVGEVLAVQPREAGVQLRIATRYDPETIALGASIACGGPCLTVVERGIDGNRAFFDVEASTETLERTTLGGWMPGTRVNLERPLKMGDELGGHMVSGHVDGIATIVERHDEEDMARFVIEVPERAGPLHRGEGLRRPRRRVAHRQRGGRPALRGDDHPAHLVGNDLGRAARRRAGEPGSRPHRALSGAPRPPADPPGFTRNTTHAETFPHHRSPLLSRHQRRAGEGRHRRA